MQLIQKYIDLIEEILKTYKNISWYNAQIIEVLFKQKKIFRPPKKESGMCIQQIDFQHLLKKKVIYSYAPSSKIY